MKLVNPADILKGKTFSYMEIFDTTVGMVLQTPNGVDYYIYDQYCMNPSCKCNDVILQYVENDELESNKGTDFAILLSLKNKKFEILDANGISKNEIQKLIEGSLKDSSEAIELFEKRYEEMKTAGKEALQAGKEKAVVKPVQVKIERNSPCPCGSGKKYKKCCGVR